MDLEVGPSGVVKSSAMRVTLVVGLIGLVGFAGLGVFSFRVAAPWWTELGSAIFVILAVVSIGQALNASIAFDGAGVRARPYPWRPILLPWQDISEFKGHRRGIYAVITGSRRQVLLLEYGRYPFLVRERQAAVQLLEDARLSHST